MKANNKCREALEKFVRAYGHEKCVHTTLLAEAYEDAKVALSEPSRNCDVGTAEEQDKRFADFCANHQTPVGCPNCKAYMPRRVPCAINWMLLPYAEPGRGEKEVTHKEGGAE